MPNDSKTQIEELNRRLESLTAEFYRGNFSSSQDVSKSTRYTTSLQVPTFTTAPTVCVIGQVYVNSGTGKLYVCSAANTWTVVGTQS